MKSNAFTKNAVILILVSATWILFGTQASHLGFYSDDVGFLVSLSGGVSSTWHAFLEYVPGRNLHIVWQKLIFVIAGTGPDDLGKLHWIQTALDSVAVVLFYQLLIALAFSPLISFTSAVFFLMFPSHGETHFWISAAPMNLVSTIFFLSYFIFALKKNKDLKTEVCSLLFFVFTFFTYDQEIFGLGLILCWTAIKNAPSKASINRLIPYAVFCAIYLFLKINPSSGPTLNRVSLTGILNGLLVSLSITHHNFYPHRNLPTPPYFFGYAIGLFALVGAGQVLSRRMKNPPGEYQTWSTGEKSLLAIGLFFATYLPSYLWAITWRHNYLPSIGLFIGLSCVMAWISKKITLHSRLKLFSRVVSLMLFFVFIFKAVVFTLHEKNDWIENYALRKAFYSDFAGRAIAKDGDYVLLEKFPDELGRSPMFIYENRMAFNYLFPHEPKVSIIPNIERDKFQSDSVASIRRLEFDQVENQKIIFHEVK